VRIRTLILIKTATIGGAMTDQENIIRGSGKRLGALVMVAILAIGIAVFIVAPKSFKDLGFWESRPQLIEGQVVTDAVNVVKRNDVKLPHTGYLFEKPLAPYARLLKIRPWYDYFWFSGDTGLIRYDPDNGEWMIYERSDGLPSDTAFDLAIDQEKGLLIEAYKKREDNIVSSEGTYWVTPEGFKGAKKTLGEAVVGAEFSVSNMNMFQPEFARAIKHNGIWWVTSLGNHKPEKDIFEGGGVYRVDPETNKATFWNSDDGLARSYSYEMTFGNDGDLWVTHWDEGRGLSRLDPKTGEIEVIKESNNGIELGGIDIASIGEYVLIGQQRGLAVYDTESKRAISIDESEGLPGYIVSDIYVDDTKVWVTAYSYEGGDKRNTGVISFSYSDIRDAFAGNKK
jgi:sugar lactone lactonase YvrE